MALFEKNRMIEALLSPIVTSVRDAFCLYVYMDAGQEILVVRRKVVLYRYVAVLYV